MKHAEKYFASRMLKEWEKLKEERDRMRFYEKGDCISVNGRDAIIEMINDKVLIARYLEEDEPLEDQSTNELLLFEISSNFESAVKKYVVAKNFEDAMKEAAKFDFGRNETIRIQMISSNVYVSNEAATRSLPKT